jgi:hypothetical protein
LIAYLQQGIAAFYPPGSLGPLSQRIAQSGALEKISAEWYVFPLPYPLLEVLEDRLTSDVTSILLSSARRLPKELAMDLLKLALFDVYVRTFSLFRLLQGI